MSRLTPMQELVVEAGVLVSAGVLAGQTEMARLGAALRAARASAETEIELRLVSLCDEIVTTNFDVTRREALHQLLAARIAERKAQRRSPRWYQQGDMA